MRAIQFDWDGEHLPEEFRKLPPGSYVVEYIEDIAQLSPEEDAGIRAALDDIEAGHVIPFDEAMRQIRAGLHAEGGATANRVGRLRQGAASSTDDTPG